MLARGISRHARWLIVLVPCLLGWVEPRGERSADVTLESYAGWTAQRFRDWCSAEGLHADYYATPTGSPVTTKPVLNVVAENHPDSPVGKRVSTGDHVGVVLEPVVVENFAGATVYFFNNWCEDYGVVPETLDSSGKIVKASPLTFIYANHTTGEVPVGGTVTVIIQGPFLTLALAVKIAVATLLLSVALSLGITQVLQRRRR